MIGDGAVHLSIRDVFKEYRWGVHLASMLAERQSPSAGFASSRLSHGLG